MKKLISILLALTMVFCLVACGDSTEAEETLSMENTTELFRTIFVDLADDVGIMTYDDCIAYMDTTGYEYETSVAYDDSEFTQIVAYDEAGFHMTVYFIANITESAVETITGMYYTNSNFEGSIQDERSSGESKDGIYYGIYDITAEKKNYDVDSLNDIISFFNDEVPGKQAEYESSISNNVEIDVTLDVSYESKNGKIYFTIETNLPDGMVLTLKLSNGDYTGQTQVTVMDGAATSEGFGNKSGAFSGSYTLSVGSIIAKLQDESVTDIIGLNGEFLVGKYVETSSVSDSNVISATFDFDF